MTALRFSAKLRLADFEIFEFRLDHLFFSVKFNEFHKSCSSFFHSLEKQNE